ncbi:hypothetical protein BJY01DRAFT_51961 [Aspergillus pseudoustus]|uniref:CCHC-type domain-containing protein n=1 Tax=Aspergillus pseudoustus TaxID=1810923 RepID=A0ABR4JA32_9EURO
MRRSYTSGQGHVSRECTVAPKEKSCYRCGGVGHISRECPQAGENDRPAGGQDRLATPAVASATWLAIALTVRSATTAAKLATFLATAPQRPRVSGFATTASNPATSRAPAPTTS